MKNPATVYLKSLQSDVSRVGMRSLLNRTASMLKEGTTLESYDWSKLTYADIYDIRAKLRNKRKLRIPLIPI